MSLFKVFRGDSSRIDTSVTPFHDGYAYLTSDDGGFYIDAATEAGEQKRIHVNPKSGQVSATLTASGWSNRLQTISVPGLGSEQNGIIALDNSVEDSMMDEIKEADLHISSQAAGSLTIEARGSTPTHDIPVVVTLLA